MIFKQNYQKLKDEVTRLTSLKGADNWGKTRNSENFDLVERTYSFGVRKCYVRKKNDQQTYLDLQSSRGINVLENDNIDRIFSNIDENMKLIASDWVRIHELDYIFSQLSESGEKISHTGFVELGFRVPRLMKYYGEEYDVKSWGFDVSPLSIGVTQSMGYDARYYNFDTCKEDPDLSGASLIVSYHMFEHISDPLKAIKKVYEKMDSGAFLHIEIPIEPGIPRLNYAHMFAFEAQDMAHMLRESGFQILTLSNQTHPDGPHIERCLARKV